MNGWPELRRRAAVALAVALVTGFAAAGCSAPSLAERLDVYAAAIDGALGLEAPGQASGEPIDTRLPRRRHRRLATSDQRIGPIDFLSTLGCSLSELIAARNGPLGRVLEPTRRLAHEIAVVQAGEACLATLSPERSERLSARLAIKQEELPAHLWNALWLDAELERFLTAGTPALLGGGDDADAAVQLTRVARAVAAADAPVVDVAAIEDAFAELRDDAAFGPWLGQLERVRATFERVALALGSTTPTACDRRARDVARIFETHYLPLQVELGVLDRRSGDRLAPLGRIYAASSRDVAVPPEMSRYGREVIDMDAPDGLWQRYRKAFLAHSAAWRPLLEACGRLPRADA